MAQEVIDIGTAPNDGLGDPLRTAFAKTNNNFSQLFSTSGITGLANGTSSVQIPIANGNVVISSAGTSNVLTVTGTGVNVAGTLNSSGLATLSNLSVTGTTISTGTIQSLADVTAVTITASGNLSANNAVITGDISAGLFTGNGAGLTGVVAVGNVGAASQLTNGITTVNIPVADGNVIGNVGGINSLFIFSTIGLRVTGLVDVTGSILGAGNIRGGNVLSLGLMSATANITGGNILTGGLISATGTVTGADLVTGGLITATGNITGGNLLVTGGVASVSGTVTGGNLLTGGLISATSTITSAANITGGNLLTGGLISATSTITSAANITGGNILTGGLISATANITGGNILTAGQIISTQTGNTTSGAGQIYLNGTGNNRIDWNTDGIGAPTTTTTSAGTKIVLYPALSGSQTDYAIGIDAATMWSSVPVNSASFNFKWYGNTTEVASLSGSGNFSATGNITSGNLSVGTGTVTVGNIVNSNSNAVGNIGSSSNYFDRVFAQATTALYADLAEIYSADAEYAPGTVVSFGGDQEVTKSLREGDNRVAGVISENPSYLMNSGLQAEHRAAVALTGRVPTLVIGPVLKGDMMVSAGNGCAQASATPAMGTVIGKALANFDGDSGIIEIVVGRL